MIKDFIEYFKLDIEYVRTSTGVTYYQYTPGVTVKIQIGDYPVEKTNDYLESLPSDPHDLLLATYLLMNGFKFYDGTPMRSYYYYKDNILIGLL